jgi:hypothetical protein
MNAGVLLTLVLDAGFSSTNALNPLVPLVLSTRGDWSLASAKQRRSALLFEQPQCSSRSATAAETEACLARPLKVRFHKNVLPSNPNSTLNIPGPAPYFDVATVAMANSVPKWERMKASISRKTNRASQPSQLAVLQPPKKTKQVRRTVSRATTPVSPLIPLTDESQPLNTPSSITAASSSVACQPASAASPQSIASTYSSDLWLKALEKLSQQDKDSIRDLVPQSTGGVKSGATVLDELCMLALKQREKCEEKRWKFSFNGQQVILRDVAQKLFYWLQKFKEAGDVAVNFDPVHAALPWAAFRFLLQVMLNSDARMFHFETHY